LEWEVLRLRRLKWSLIRARGLEALEGFLVEHLDYDVYAKQFAEDLAEFLQDFLPEDQADSAQTLANKYVRNEADAVHKVTDIGVAPARLLDDARAHKAKELVQRTCGANRTP
jgi:hypothetical protein